MKIYNFVCEYGTIETIRVNMDDVRSIVNKWSNENPAPSPPLKRPEYYREYAKEMLAIKEEMGISRQEAIEEWRNRQQKVPNVEDESYKAQMNIYKQKQVAIMAGEMIMMGIIINCNGERIPLREAIKKGCVSEKDLLMIAKVRINAETYRNLYYHILNISELTEQAVMEAIDRLGYIWEGKPLVEWANSGVIPKGSSSSSWASLGAMAAKEVEGIGPYKFKQLEIAEQAEITAIYLVDGWLKALQYEKQKSEQEARKNSIGPK